MIIDTGPACLLSAQNFSTSVTATFTMNSRLKDNLLVEAVSAFPRDSISSLFYLRILKIEGEFVYWLK